MAGATSHGHGTWSPSTSGDWWKPEIEAREDCELLPRFVQGWYLLADANLSQTERNLVQTALGGNFDVDKVAQELRNQWSDSEIRHRDQGRHGGYLGEAMEDEFDADHLDEDTAWLMNEDEPLVDSTDMTEANTEVQAAMVAALGARRTLREARQRQHQVKMNRQYFRSSNQKTTTSATSSSGRSAGKPSDANLTCLRCGKVGHMQSSSLS